MAFLRHTSIPPPILSDHDCARADPSQILITGRIYTTTRARARGLLLLTLRSRPPTTQAATAFSELGNLAFSGGAKLMSLFGERTTNTAASSSSDSTTSEPDLEASYAELEAVGALSEGAASLPGSAAAETGFYTVVGGVVRAAAHPPLPVPSPPSPAHPLLPPSAARLLPDQVGQPLRP